MRIGSLFSGFGGLDISLGSPTGIVRSIGGSVSTLSYHAASFGAAWRHGSWAKRKSR